MKMLSIVTFTFLGLEPASAQQTSVSITALNGKTGKPIVHQRLLIFGGETVEKLSVHQFASEVVTDESGHALVNLNLKVTQIRVFADFMTLCQSKTDPDVFPIEQIKAGGLSASNTCSSFKETLAPGHLTIYARTPTLREKMAW